MGEDRGFLGRLVDTTKSGRSLVFWLLAGYGLQRLFWKLQDYLKRRLDMSTWTSHVDFDQIQVCLLSTEHLHELGRIEKRTLMVRDLRQFFAGNSYVVEKVLAAAAKSCNETDGKFNSNSILVKFLPAEDKWHILNICTNQISSLFAPYHIFFNEARRCPSYYRSAWYCFTMTSSRTRGTGRYFITPFKPVLDVEDVGCLRIRVVLVNEDELRDICTGTISPPSWGFFNERHKQRWDTMKEFSELFEKQLTKIESNESMDSMKPPTSLLLAGRGLMGYKSRWGANLCGRIGADNKLHHDQQHSLPSSFASPMSSAAEARDDMQMYKNFQLWSSDSLQHGIFPTPSLDPLDNCFLRMHIPFPAGMSVGKICEGPVNPNQSTSSAGASETRSKDVVLYE